MLFLFPYLLIIVASMWGYHTILRVKVVELERKSHNKISLQNQFSQYLANKLASTSLQYDRRLDFVKVLGLSNIYGLILPFQHSNNNCSFIEKAEKIVQLATLTTNRRYELIVDKNILHFQLSYEKRRKILKTILAKCLSYRAQEMTYITIRREDSLIEIKIESPLEELEEILTF